MTLGTETVALSTTLGECGCNGLPKRSLYRFPLGLGYPNQKGINPAAHEVL